ncbi:hypothetical protein FQZ97_661820 [compost metagenome]
MSQFTPSGIVTNSSGESTTTIGAVDSSTQALIASHDLPLPSSPSTETRRASVGLLSAAFSFSSKWLRVSTGDPLLSSGVRTWPSRLLALIRLERVSPNHR